MRVNFYMQFCLLLDFLLVRTMTEDGFPHPFSNVSFCGDRIARHPYTLVNKKTALVLPI